MRRITFSFYFALILLLISCQKNASEIKSSPEASPKPLFELLEPGVSGVNFTNRIEESLNLNVLMYEYLYNGAGVAVGDLNGDGLDDLYFSANVSGPKLYLNQGNLIFKDITETAKVQGIPGPWNTGVVFADVNGDGLLDIYQCRSGALPPGKRKNLLFINQGSDETGTPIFEEKGAEFGIDSSSPSTSASFFDFDRDGDLDLFLLNHNTRSIQNQDVSRTMKLLKEKNEAGSQLFENRNGVFVEITTEAGISSSVFSYGLGISTADINKDGWPDIYIGNDYAMPDYLYINQKDGTFNDELSERLGHISNFSMGNDIADINNDGLPDIFTLDMLPEDNYRQKLLLAPDNYEVFQLNLDKGWHHQYMRNMLHVNDGTGKFQEVGQFSGLSNTDWSWAALFADFDNDGWKDLFVSNGYLRDYNNQDFLMYMENYVQTSGGKLKREDLLDLVKTMPSTGLSNYIFQNQQDLQFENKTGEWGFDIPLTSNGAAYSDLDNDGDLDLIVNNINSPASIFENKSNELQAQNYLKIKLLGENKNTFALGTQVSAYSGHEVQYLEQNPYRGFQSSVSPVLHLGLGEESSIDSLVISWPEGSVKILRSVSANQTLEIDPTTGEEYKRESPKKRSILSKQFEVHLKKGIQSNDFKRQPMLLHPISNQQQAWTMADFDQDGHPDLFVGGERGVSGGIIYHLTSFQSKALDSASFERESPAEDSHAVAFDANGDGKTDLLVAGGGLHQFQSGAKEWEPRLYLNEGNRRFMRVENAFQGFSCPVSTILTYDFNGDGAEDVLLASRVTPDQYPLSSGAQIWINDRAGKFTEETQKYAPELFELGMITDAKFVDLDQNGSDELILVGEAMPISIFENQGKLWEEATERYFETPLIGFWNHIQSADWDQNGNMELIVGNLGRNTQLRASNENPMELIFKDFDKNGSMDAVYGFPVQGEIYPLVSRGELLSQMPLLKKRYLDFKSYASLKFEDLFSQSERSDAEIIQINELETVYLRINSLGKFEKKPLPQEVQFSPVFASHAMDLNDDGNLDLILGGNMDFGKISLGKYDASRGLILLGDGTGKFQALSPEQSGISVLGDTRGITKTEDYLIWIEKSKAVHFYKQNLTPN